MKFIKYIFVIAIITILQPLQLMANVAITAATGGGSLCSDSYTTLGDIVIKEGQKSDFAIGAGVTLILTAPNGYEFNAGVGSVSYTAAKNLSAASIVVTTSTITVTYTCSGINKSDILTISGIEVKASNALPVAASGKILRTVANPGTGSIAGIINGTTNFGTLTQAATMAYSSSSVTQNNTSNVGVGSDGNEIICIPVVVTGICLSPTATSFTLNTNGSTNAAVDISRAQLYYSTTSTFSTATLFGSQNNPNGSFTINGSQILISGTNYFWLSYDIPGSALLNDVVDGECTSIVVDGSSYTPSPTNAIGSRTIVTQCPSGLKEAGTNSVVNGDFSAGNFGFTSGYTYVANDPDPSIRTELWPEGYYSVWTCPKDLHYMWSEYTTGHGGSGNFLIVNGNTVDNIVVWQENITVSPNTTYYFTAWLCSVHPSNPAQLQFSVDGTNIGAIFTAPGDTLNHWQQFYATWNSGANTTATISIVNKNTIASGNDFGLDDINFVPCQDATLPIELLYFNAKAVYAKNEINWSTSSEINNHYFTVEKSSDGVTFSTLSTIEGAGNSNSVLKYSTEDASPYKVVTYYRLKQTDFNGNFTYSNIVAVSGNQSGSLTMKVLPSQGNNNIHLLIRPDNSKNFTVSVFDISGKMIYTKDLGSMPSTDNYFTISPYNLSNGIYLIRLNSDTESIVQKAMIR